MICSACGENHNLTACPKCAGEPRALPKRWKYCRECGVALDGIEVYPNETGALCGPCARRKLADCSVTQIAQMASEMMRTTRENRKLRGAARLAWMRIEDLAERFPDPEDETRKDLKEIAMLLLADSGIPVEAVESERPRVEVKDEPEGKERLYPEPTPCQELETEYRVLRGELDEMQAGPNIADARKDDLQRLSKLAEELGVPPTVSKIQRTFGWGYTRARAAIDGALAATREEEPTE